MGKNNFLTRAYNKIQKIENGRIIKSSSSTRLKDEINYYENIPSSVNFLFPRKFSSSSSNQEISMTLEYYPYKNLGEYLISDLSLDWYVVFNNLKNILFLFKSQKDVNQSTSQYAKQMYLDKTLNEYLNLKKSFDDFDLFDSECLIINDVEYKNFEFIWEKFISNKILNTLMDYESTMIHGDMCFSNILFHENAGIRFIDMRGSFGKLGIYGDSLYDLAKLAHSIDGGYEFFINDKFKAIKHLKNKYELTIENTSNKIKAFDSFWDVFSNENKNSINLVQGLIYIGMCARHYDSKDRQLAMYLTGIKLLNKIL